MKNKGTTAILALLFGAIGAHRFYLGHNGLGFLYLLASWTLIPAFIAFCEFFYFLLMGEQEFNQKYNAAPLMLQAQPAHAQMGQNVTVNLAGATGPSVDVGAQLQKLNDLRIAGVLSEDEFHLQKQKLLA